MPRAHAAAWRAPAGEGEPLTRTTHPTGEHAAGAGDTTRIAVLISGRGSNLSALLDAIDADPNFGGAIALVATDNPQAEGLAHARARTIPTAVVPFADFADRAEWELQLRDAVAAHEVDLVVLAGFMKILSSAFLERWPDCIINTHPSLLPAFRGAHAVRDTLAAGVKVTGATVHIVVPDVDAGAIIDQRAVSVMPDDDEDALHARIRAVEHALLPDCVRAICQGRLRRDGDVVHIVP